MLFSGNPTYFNGKLNITHPEVELPADDNAPISFIIAGVLFFNRKT